ncbi:MAG: carboxypeptidase regulatory-like domain-containing protein, partial [Bryobacteraceae bacterium]
MFRNLFLLAALTGLTSAQTVSTQILGLVTDQSGAALPNAAITARHVATGQSRTAHSNDTGNYVFPILEVGEYEVTCGAQGFKTEVRRGIVLQIQQKARIDFQLQVGQQVERVEVSSAAPLLRTEDATLGSVVEHKRVVDLPLNMRNFGQLATLTPGVTFTNARMGLDGQGTIGTRAMPGQIVGVTANGQRDITPNITLDGVNATDGFKSAMLFSPSVEAIEEFKIQSAVYSAEYGMNSGAQMNVIIKSGTNQLHGSGFEFVRNDKFDARGFFLAPNAEKNRLRRNQFGGVLSGRIKKDHTFWLANFEGRREIRSSPGRATVATTAMRNGDFSELLEPGNRWYPTTPVANLTIRLPGDTTPFPGNVIPRNLINPVSVNILTYKKTSPFPEGGFIAPPNFDAQARAARSPQNLLASNDQVLNSDQTLGRVDHRFGDNDRIFGRYVLVESAWDNNPLVKVSRQITDYRAMNLGMGYSKIISPTMLNEVRFGFN